MVSAESQESHLACYSQPQYKSKPGKHPDFCQVLLTPAALPGQLSLLSIPTSTETARVFLISKVTYYNHLGNWLPSHSTPTEPPTRHCHQSLPQVSPYQLTFLRLTCKPNQNMPFGPSFQLSFLFFSCILPALIEYLQAITHLLLFCLHNLWIKGRSHSHSVAGSEFKPRLTFYLFIYVFLATLHGRQDLSFLTKNHTRAPAPAVEAQS